MKSLNNIFLGMNTVDVFNGLENVGIYITDLQRRIVFWNSAAAKIMGYSSADVVGKCCHDNVLCHLDRHGRPLCSEEFCPLHHSIQVGKGSSVNTFVFGKNHEGKRVPLTVTVSPVRDENGTIVGGIELFRNAALEWEQLRMAQAIQQRFMPDPVELNRSLPLAFHWMPADMVGGDYVQVNRVEDRVVIGLLADVSGHGIASAMLTGFLWRALEGVPLSASRPTEILHALSRQYQALNMETHYFSALCFRYDLAAETLVLANAGHPLPILIGKNHEAEYVKLNGDLIGLFEDPSFEERSIDMSGSRLIVYSDGCVEAHNPAGEDLGSENFLAQCRALTALPRQDAARTLVDRSFAFTQAPEPEDDMTVLIIEGKSF